MKFLLTTILLLSVNSLFSQKPVIDSVAYKAWPSLEQPTISKNGQYVSYNIQNVPIGSNTLVVQSTNGKWKMEFKGEVKEGRFSDKYFLFVTKNDSLGMLVLGTNQIKYIPNISWYNLQKTKKEEFLWYPSYGNPKTYLLKNLETNKEMIFTNVDNWNFEDGILVLFKSTSGNDQKQSINLVDITTGKVSKIWDGYKPENLISDIKHKQFAFKTGDSVWYYKTGLSEAICISDRKSSNMESRLTLGYLESFSYDGKFIFTSLIGKRKVKPQTGIVEVWSYTDVKLQTEQEKEFPDQTYLAVVNIEAHRLIRLQQQEEEMFQFQKSAGADNTVALIENLHLSDSHWSNTYEPTWNLVSLKNGDRRRLDFLNKNNINAEGVKLSPCGKFIIYFDRVKKDYFSYEISTSRIRNLTKDVPNISDLDEWYNGSSMSILPRSVVAGQLFWTKNDESLLLYDQYDIWELDPLSARKAVNITNGYGKRNGLIFHMGLKEYNEQPIDKGQTLILNCFNLKNKDNGYYSKRLGENGDPSLLTMGSYIFDLINTGYLPGEVSFAPCKAKDADSYVVRRMSASEAPNYYSTKDFKSFTQLSDLQFQKQYNWYTTELHDWKSLDGRVLQGILYKPENFDPNKKYPVILYYYQRKSNGLNSYVEPEPLSNGGCINIPTYVSQGYLVFSPDIYYKEGDPMQGTYDAVVSAAGYLSTLPFVNSKKMGLQGHSFGGVQTNYLVTHTNLFAAAESSAGLADFVSFYGTLAGGTDSRQDFNENGQLRMGGSLWEKPEAYIKNSAIFQIEKVTTPILLMHTKSDDIANVMEFFTGLRRMGKKAWMLVYSEGNHGVWKKEAEDLSVRMMQFFDHYLKDKPAPLWMLDGVSAKDRSWDAGLKLDTNGRTPGQGLLTAEEQEKVNTMMTRKPITITLK